MCILVSTSPPVPVTMLTIAIDGFHCIFHHKNKKKKNHLMRILTDQHAGSMHDDVMTFSSNSTKIPLNPSMYGF